MSRYQEKGLVEDVKGDSSYTNYGFTGNSQQVLYNVRALGYGKNEAVNFPTTNVIQNENQKDTYYNDYGNCYTITLDANIKNTENLRPNTSNIQGNYHEKSNQNRTNSRGDVNEASQMTHSKSHHYDVDQLHELHARRAQHRAQKQKQVIDPLLDQLARVEPIEVTFFDRKKGIEYDAYGQVIVPSPLDANAPAYIDFNEEVVQPSSAPPHYDQQNLDRGHPVPSGDYHQPIPDHLQPFQEWYKGYNPSVQQGEQPTPSWLTPQKAPKVPNYLIFSIVACFFCLPIGGIALGYVINSSNQRKEGKYQAAIESASTAHKLCIVAIVLGVIALGVSGFLIWYQIQRINKIISPKT